MGGKKQGVGNITVINEPSCFILLQPLNKFSGSDHVPCLSMS